MREIKFRVRDQDTNRIMAFEWINAGTWHHQEIAENGEHYQVKRGVSKYVGFNREQCIGIVDKNGKDIYEGDTIKTKGSVFSKYVKLQVQTSNPEYPGVIMLISNDNHCAITDVIEDIEVVDKKYITTTMGKGDMDD